MTALPMTRAIQQRQTPGGIVLPLPSPLLAMLPPNLQGLPMTAYWANFPLIALTAAGGATPTATGTYNQNPNYWLAAWFGLASLRSTDNQTDRSTSPLTAQLSDNNNTLFQPQGTATDIRNFFSTIGISSPAVWVSPVLVPPSGALNLQLTNLDTVNAINARCTLVGVLIQVTT